jgi:hypothetical protein
MTNTSKHQIKSREAAKTLGQTKTIAKVILMMNYNIAIKEPAFCINNINTNADGKVSKFYENKK